MAEVDVKVVRVQLSGRDSDLAKLEEEFRNLRREGFEWAIAGGGTAIAKADIAGFVIMERPKPQ